MILPEPAGLIESLERSGWRTVIVATGGGSEAIAHLLTTPGASNVVLEAIVPYASGAVDRWLGGPQESYCSSRTARRLAVLAWQRACALGTPPGRAVGAAVTASLRTRQPKQGPHRIFVAVQTLASTRVATLVLLKNARSRRDEEQIAAALLLNQLAEECCRPPIHRAEMPLLEGEQVELDRESAALAWQELFAGVRRIALAESVDQTLARTAGATLQSPEATLVEEEQVLPGRLVFSGSFDPLHDGHRLMAATAEDRVSRRIEYELSITNVDKPALDYVEIRERLLQFSGQTLWLTRAATFLDKIDIFPASTFVMGADTYKRLCDPKYYGGSADAAARSVRHIAESVRGIIVFGRQIAGLFENSVQNDVPETLRRVSLFISEQDFRRDISSTQLRQQEHSSTSEPDDHS